MVYLEGEGFKRYVDSQVLFTDIIGLFFKPRIPFWWFENEHHVHVYLLRKDKRKLNNFIIGHDIKDRIVGNSFMLKFKTYYK